MARCVEELTILVSDTQNDFLYMYIWCSQQIFSPKKVREVQGVPQSQVPALPRHQEEEETDKTKQVQNEQIYEKH